MDTVQEVRALAMQTWGMSLLTASGIKITWHSPRSCLNSTGPPMVSTDRSSSLLSTNNPKTQFLCVYRWTEEGKTEFCQLVLGTPNVSHKVTAAPVQPVLQDLPRANYIKDSELHTHKVQRGKWKSLKKLIFMKAPKPCPEDALRHTFCVFNCWL